MTRGEKEEMDKEGEEEKNGKELEEEEEEEEEERGRGAREGARETESWTQRATRQTESL